MYDRTTPASLAAALSVSVVASLLSVASGVFLPPVWRRSWWKPWHRVHYTVVVVGLFMMIWWVYFWNLMVFRV